MNPTILSQLKNGWFKKINELKKKRRPRRYLHFDKPKLEVTTVDLNKISSEKFVRKHAFFPLIKIPINSRLYKKDPVFKIKTIEWKERPISYASHYDSLIYSWYTYILEYFYENRLIKAGLTESVIAYRKLNKSNIHFALEVFEFIKKKENCVAIGLDVKGFYDNLDHELVKKSWKENLNVTDLPSDHYTVYKSVTKYAYVRLREVFKVLGMGVKDFRKSSLFFNTDLLESLRKGRKIKTNNNPKKLNTHGNNFGIPQGTPISCALSNIYMFDFDKAVFNKVNSIGGLYRRYSDDIVIICPLENIKDVQEFVFNKISELRLEIKKEKTETRFFAFENGKIVCRNEENRVSKLQYLGVEFYGDRVILRHKGYANYERRMGNSVLSKHIQSKEKGIPLFKRKIYEKYSPFGSKNYFDYIKNATKTLKTSSFKVITSSTDKQRVLGKINKKIKKLKREDDKKR